MSNKILLFVILFSFISLNYTSAQVVSETQARAELQKRGISESELRTALLAKGIDLDKIDPTNASEFQRVQRIIEETVTELEQKKDKPNTGTPASGSNEAVAKEGGLEVPVQPVNSTVATPVVPVVSPPPADNNANETTPIYGQGIFTGGNMKVFNKVEDGRATGSYILGPGDAVSVSIWGASVINTSQTIGKEGYIQPEGMPRLFLSGLSVSEAEKFVRAAYSRRAIFNTNDFSFSVISPRNLNVNIYGEVKVNGTFYLSALNSAFNALVAAGGLTTLGSVRKITLQRAGSKPKRLDVYEFINNPIIANEFYLQENDFIHVPAAEKLVRITGAIVRPATYELIGEEKLSDLLKFAGGPRSNALMSSVQLKRYENNAQKIVDINYDELLKNKGDLTLLNGDEIMVKFIDFPVENIVTVEGAVYYPDQYAVSQGTRISEILKRAQLRDNANTDLVYLRRVNDDKKTVRYELVNASAAIASPGSAADLLLTNGDALIIRSSGDFAKPGSAVILGAVNRPGSFQVNVDGNLSLKDAIYISGGLKENATNFGYLFKNNPKTPTVREYQYIDLENAEILNQKINSGDSIVIYSKEAYTDLSKVSITGAVRSPSDYVYNPSLTLKDLIILAGGLRIDAAPNKVDVFRLDYDQNKTTKTIAKSLDLKNSNIFDSELDFPLQPFDIVVVRQAPEFRLQTSVTIQGEVVYPGIYAAIQENTRLSSVIKQAGGLTNQAYNAGAKLFRSGVGFIVVDLQAAMNQIGGPQDFILEDGDLITVPKRNSLVSIEGAVHIDEVASDIARDQGKLYVSFLGKKSAKYYVQEYAGGFKENAKTDDLIVEYQNGKIKKTSKFLFFKKYPKVMEGSKIYVPYKVEKPVKEGSEDEDVDWGKVLSSAVAQATAVLSLILLLRAVN